MTSLLYLWSELTMSILALTWSMHSKIKINDIMCVLVVKTRIKKDEKIRRIGN